MTYEQTERFLLAHERYIKALEAMVDIAKTFSHQSNLLQFGDDGKVHPAYDYTDKLG